MAVSANFSLQMTELVDPRCRDAFGQSMLWLRPFSLASTTLSFVFWLMSLFGQDAVKIYHLRYVSATWAALGLVSCKHIFPLLLTMTAAPVLAVFMMLKKKSDGARFAS